jgi:hypothetical protein
MNNPLTIIFRRRAEIEREMQECRDRLQRLQSELPELDVAERVLTRLGGAQQDSLTAIPTQELLDTVADRLLDETPVVSKPPGIPTMPEMIREAIHSWERIDPEGLEPKDILRFIAEKWWPEVRPELVGPIAWRMWKRGDLVKNGPRYGLPPKNEATDNEPAKGSSVASETGLFE